jgi:cytochrome c5
MKHHKIFISATALTLLALSATIKAEEVDGNWKNGRIYYRMVCTDCHVKQAGGKISPAEKTKAEWLDYFEKNLHGSQDAPAKYAATYFISQEYRESIKNTNRAAAKMLNIPDDQLLADVKAFLVHTAKDSDQPARCE